MTSSRFDVQFNDLSKTYAFGLVAFDNAPVRHTMYSQTLTPRFALWEGRGGPAPLWPGPPRVVVFDPTQTESVGSP